MNITSLGVGSGLPLEDLVTAYIDAEAIPQEQRLQQKEEALNTELSGVGSFKSSLSKFDDILDKLSQPDAFNKQTVTASTEDISVTTNGFASNGTFEIEVQQLAQGSQLKSTALASSATTLGAGTLTLTAGTDTFDVAIDATDDLSAIRDKINEQSENFGVTANIINSDAGSYLVYTSDKTGAANSLTVTTSDASLDAISTNNTTEKSAQDARIVIDGNTITSETNEFKNAIEDVTITAKAENLGNPTTLTIAQDEENASDLIKEFVDGFNELTTNLVGLGAPSLGRLAFDPNVRSVKQQMADIVLNEIAGATGINSLSQIGVELNKEGELEISQFSTTSLPSGQERLDDALENNLDQVGELFASSDGIATQLSTMIDGYIKSDGVLTLREKSLNERIDSVKDEWEELEERLRSREATLRAQFTALDSTVAQYNSTASYVTTTLNTMLPNNSNSQ